MVTPPAISFLGDAWRKSGTRAMVLVLLLATLLYVGSRVGISQDRAPEIPNCPMGSLVLIGQGLMPDPGSKSFDDMTFDTPEEAAESAFARYREGGRTDGRLLEPREFRWLAGEDSAAGTGRASIYVPFSDDPDRGDVLFIIDQVAGRYAVVEVRACEGAEGPGLGQ